MAQNNFIINLLASLKKQQSKKQLETDAKNLGDIKVPLVGTLNKVKTKRQIKQDLASLNETVNLKGKINKREIITSLKQATQQAQMVANKNTIQVSMKLKKDKLINDIKVFGQQNTRLFKDANMAKKYNLLLNNAELAASSKEIQNLRLQLSAMRSEIKANNLSGLTLADTFKKTFKRAIELFTGTGGVMLLSRQLRQAWSEALNLNKAYTDLIKVQKELSRGDYSAYLEQCNKKAQELAFTQQALIEGAVEFSKSGYDLLTSDALTEKSTILSNVGEMSASDSAKAIISGIQAYDIIDGYTDVVDKAEALIDKYNEIGNTASITTAEIAEGVQAVGSVFSDANTSIDGFIALLAAGNRQYQNADTLSLGLRTSALRIRGCTTELEAMGEETDTVITSTAKLEEKIKALTNINGSGGVKILEADGETFRSIYDIYVDIGKVYKDMSDINQSALLDLIAGKTRASAISATLNNMSEAQEIYQRSLDSTGSAQEEYNIYLESSEASLNRFKASMTETYQSVINGQTVTGLLNCGNATLQFVNSLGLVENTLKGLIAIGIVKAITTLSTAFKASAIQVSNFGTALNALKDISVLKRGTVEYTDAMKTLTTASAGLSETQLKQVLASNALNDSQRISILRASGLTKAQAQAKLAQMGLTQSTQAQTVANGAATASTFSLKAAVTGLGRSLKITFMSNPIGMTIMGISMAVGLATSVMSKYKNKLEEIKEAAEEAKSAIDQIKSEFDSLSSSTDNIKRRFAELAQSVDNLGKTNQSRGKLSTEDYNEFLDLSNQLSELFPQLRIGFDDNGNAILDLSGNVDTIVGSLNNLVSVQQKLANQQILEQMPKLWDDYTSDLEDYNKKIKDAESKVSEYKNALEDFSAKYDNGTKTWSLQGDPQQDKELYKHQNSFITALKKINVDYHDVYNFDVEDEGFWENITWDFSKLSDVQISEFKNALATLASEYENSIMLTKDKITAANSGMSSYINTWLSTDFGAMLQLEKMSPDLQNVVKDVLLDSTNWIEVIPKNIKPGDWEAVSDWLENEFLYAITQIDDAEIQTALVDAFNGNFSVDILQEIIDQLTTTKGFDENNPLIIYLQTKINDKTEKIDAVKTRVNSDLSEDELNEKIYSLSDEDLSIAADISITDNSLLSWDELIAKIEEAKEQIKKSSITSFKDAFNAADFADSKEKLLELAKSGEITGDVIESTDEYKTLLTQTKLSAEEVKQEILGMLTATEKLSAASKGMDSLSTAFNEWQDKGFVTAETLEALPDAFKKDTEKFDLFSQIVGDPTNSEAEIQQAFNDIATEYLKTQGTLGKVTKENTEIYIANLKDMGIANAEEVVEEYVTAKDEFNTLLSEAYEEWMSHLNDDEQALGEYLSATDTKNAELMNAFGEEYSTDYQNWLDLLQKKKDTYKAYTEAIEGTLVEKGLAMGLYVKNENQDKELQKFAAEYSAKLASTKFTSNSLDYTGSKDSSSSSSSKDSSQTYDWIEIKINRLNDALDSIKTKADNVYSSWTERNTELANAISNTKKAIDLQSQAYNRYIQEANSVGLSDNYKKLVQSGAIDISTISDETLKEKISDYQTWYEKAQECLKTQDDLNAELNELNTQKFDNIKSEYDAVINRMQSAYDLLENQITLLSSSGSYDTLRNKQTDIVNKLQSERNALQNNLNSLGIQQYTEEWYTLISQIDDLDSQILDAENVLKDIDNLQFDNIKEAFDFDTSVLEHGLQTIQNKIDLLELKGQFANESYYNGMIEYTQQQLDTLKNERTQLQNILNNTLYKQGTSEWNNMYSTLMDIDEEIDSMTNNLTEYNNAIRDLNWEIFEYLEESLNRITDETDYLVELLSKKDLFDENGQITNYGTTSMALHAAAYDVYKQQAQDYYEEVQDLQKQLVNGAGEEVLAQYNNMVKAHQDAVLAAEDEKQAILDLIEDGYNAQLDALQRLIDKKKEQLNAEKNLYDYQKSIAEKADNISSLEKQKLAYEGDTSEEAMSKIQQIKVQLEEAKADLKESEYEQYLSDTETMLDQLAEDYEDWMNERLDHSDELIAQVIGEILLQSGTINTTLKETSDYYGTFISDSLNTIFNSDSPFTQSLTGGLNDVSNSLNSGLGGVSTSVAGTTTAINNLVSQVANIVNAEAAKTNAGSNVATNNNGTNDASSAGSTNNSSNPAINTPSTSISNTNKNTTTTGNSPTSNTTSSSTSSSSNTAKTGKSLLDSILISKKDYYPKGSLNIDTSVVDRLKYNDKDSSFSARSTYWNKIFGGTYTGSPSQNTKLLNYLKSNGYKSGTSNATKGYHWTQEDGEEIIYRTSDGAVLTPLNDGDMVFDNESSKRLWELSKNPEAYMKKYNIDPSTITATIPQPTFNFSVPDFGSIGSRSYAPTINVGGVDVTCNGVNNVDELMDDIIDGVTKNNRFEKAMNTSINHHLTGKGTSLDKMKYTR